MLYRQRLVGIAWRHRRAAGRSWRIGKLAELPVCRDAAVHIHPLLPKSPSRSYNVAEIPLFRVAADVSPWLTGLGAN
jgi:hypothetical protein